MPASPGANQNRRDIRVVTAFVKILKIQGVVNDLVHVLHAKVGFADFELEDKNDRADDDDGVDATAHARDDELEVDRASLMRQHVLKDGGLFQPRFPLIRCEVEVVVTRQATEDRVAVGRTEVVQRA